MTAVVLFATPGAPDKATLDKYRAALEPLPGATLRLIPIAGFSSVFVQEIARLRTGDGRLLPATLRKYAPNDSPSSVVFVGYSAGGWYGRDGLLAHPDDRAAIDAALFIDALHGTPEQIRHVAAYANEGGRLYVEHTNVQTSGYPSTTETAESLRAMAPSAEIIHRAPLVSESQKQQHGKALTEHGPIVLREVMKRLASEKPQPEPFNARDVDGTIGQRRLAWLGHEWGQPGGVVEVPGGASNPRIVAYSEHCRRGGTFLGYRHDGVLDWAGGAPLRAPGDHWSWCMIVQSAGLAASLRPGEKPPHGLRVSVREGWEDAVKAGTARGIDYEPQPGDLQILARYVVRGGKTVLADPTKGDNGHVRAFVRATQAGKGWFFGGNESTPRAPQGELNYSEQVIRDPLLRGWIACG